VPGVVIARVWKPVLIAITFGLATFAQTSRVPRFEDYPVEAVYTGKPAEPVLVTPEEQRFRTVIRRGVAQGWGVEDGVTGKEIANPGPNFAGRYVIVKWGCGSPCLMAAFVDLANGRVLPPPFHHGPGHSFFQVPWAFPKVPLQYRVNSRLLIANICETDKVSHLDGHTTFAPQRCGTHYFVIGEKWPDADSP
jgi:hypothetical protein